MYLLNEQHVTRNTQNASNGDIAIETRGRVASRGRIRLRMQAISHALSKFTGGIHRLGEKNVSSPGNSSFPNRLL